MSYDVSEKPEDALDLGPDDRDDDQPNNAPTLPTDEPEEEHDDEDEGEPDGRWIFSTEAGCYLYE